MVISNVKEILSIEAFEAALPGHESAGEMRNQLVDIFTENVNEQFEALCAKHNLFEKLTELDERIRTPLIGKKRHLLPLKRSPLESMQEMESEMKEKQKIELEAELATLQEELQRVEEECDSNRKRAKLILEKSQKMHRDFSSIVLDGADTEDEE